MICDFMKGSGQGQAVTKAEDAQGRRNKGLRGHPEVFKLDPKGNGKPLNGFNLEVVFN